MSAELTDAVGFAAAAAAALIATPVAISIARRTDFFDHPRGYRQHGGPTPLLGGAAVLVAVAVAVAAIGASTGLLVALGCAAGLCLLGAIDDRIAVAPKWRVLAEVGAAA